MSAALSELETPTANDLLDLDIRMNLGMDGAPGPTLTVPSRPWSHVEEPAPAVSRGPHSASAAVAVAEAPVASSSRILDRLVAMADAYLDEGSSYQALEMYFDLVNSYPDTPQADLASERVLEVARRHELAGELRQARSIYERLL